MNKYFIVLTGAKKNIGDFLITDRAKKLLQHVHPEYELVQLPSWESLTPHLELVNNSKGVIILGGPGYSHGMYPHIYPLTPNLDDIQVPISILGGGWFGSSDLQEVLECYSFSEESRKLLDRIIRDGHSLSCRDYLTQSVLNYAGYKDVTMTGCPVWYNLDYLDKPFKLPLSLSLSSIKKIVYTPAASPTFRDQSVDIMKLLKRRFPHAQIYCSFHRGIDSPDQYTHQWEIDHGSFLAEHAKALGLIVVDTSFDLDRIKFYQECDFHIGYRVHAHIDFISQRKFSILLNEDGRGCGANKSLGTIGIDAFQVLDFNNFLANFRPRFIAKVIRKFLRIGQKYIWGDESQKKIPSQSAVRELDRYLGSEFENIIFSNQNAFKNTDNKYKVMEKFIKNLK